MLQVIADQHLFVRPARHELRNKDNMSTPALAAPSNAQNKLPHICFLICLEPHHPMNRILDRISQGFGSSM